MSLQKTEKHCVKGEDMVDWITKSITKSPEASVEIAKELINLKLIKNVQSQAFDYAQYFKRVKPKAINEWYLWPDQIASRDPIIISVELLTLATQLFEENKSFITKFAMDGMSILSIHPIYYEFQCKSAELQYVKLTDMTDAQKIVFFVNIYNTLALHCYISEYRKIPKGLSELNCIGFLSNHKYNIAGHYFSLYQIDHAILRANSHLPDVVFSSAVCIFSHCYLRHPFTQHVCSLSQNSRKTIPDLHLPCKSQQISSISPSVLARNPRLQSLSSNLYL